VAYIVSVFLSKCCDSLEPPRIESSSYGMVYGADAFLILSVAAYIGFGSYLLEVNM
jgi:hypothetical protein